MHIAQVGLKKFRVSSALAYTRSAYLCLLEDKGRRAGLLLALVLLLPSLASGGRDLGALAARWSAAPQANHYV